jgi:hypothetical protein
MFYQGLGLSPSQYSQFKMKPVALLARIYTYLDTHFRKSSSWSLVAVFAYLLTTSSKIYLQALCRSVAYADSNSQRAATSQQPQRTAIGPLDIEDFDQASPEDDGVLFAEDDELPSFLPRDLAEVLPAAQVAHYRKTRTSCTKSTGATVVYHLGLVSQRHSRLMENGVPWRDR